MSQIDGSINANYPLFLSDFKEAWTSLTDFQKILKFQITCKSFQCEPNCFARTDGGQTDVTELIVALRNFSKARNTFQLLCFRALAYENAILSLESHLRHIRGKRDYLLRTGNMTRNEFWLHRHGLTWLRKITEYVSDGSYHTAHRLKAHCYALYVNEMRD